MGIKPFNENALPIVARCIETYGGYVAGKTYPVVKHGEEVYVVRLDEHGDERSMLCFEATIREGNVGLYPAIGDGTIPDVVFEAETLSLNTLRDVIYQDAVAHGLWDWAEAYQHMPDLRDSSVDLIRGEVCELEIECGSEERYAEELADVIIVSLSVAGKLGIDIDEAIRRKMEINKKRPWKHGKE